mmetsp:Transcript_22842/g.57254  ORF Transcript_22842/g.57254 Transcript_22842/m.57254 type:complete len:239 (+) Transcript_22842:209-925(+)
MIQVSPDSRLNVDELLNHPWMNVMDMPINKSDVPSKNVRWKLQGSQLFPNFIQPPKQHRRQKSLTLPEEIDPAPADPAPADASAAQDPSQKSSWYPCLSRPEVHKKLTKHKTRYEMQMEDLHRQWRQKQQTGDVVFRSMAWKRAANSLYPQVSQRKQAKAGNVVPRGDMERSNALVRQVSSPAHLQGIIATLSEIDLRTYPPILSQQSPSDSMSPGELGPTDEEGTFDELSDAPGPDR